MGRPWADHDSWELVQEASEVVGRDVAHLLLDADANELKDTRNAQLTTFVSSLMVLDAVERLGVSPDVLAGHSLGEYTALAASGDGNGSASTSHASSLKLVVLPTAVAIASDCVEFPSISAYARTPYDVSRMMSTW